MSTGHNPYQEPLQPGFCPDLLGPLELVTPASGLAATVARAKAWLRVDSDAEDELIEELLADAAAYCESEIWGNRQLLAAIYTVRATGWWEGELALPRPPLQDVLSVAYYDAGGTQQTLATTVYQVRKPLTQPGVIERTPDQVWPGLQGDRLYPVAIQFRAGYVDADAVPPLIRRAILLLVSHWYHHREAQGRPVEHVDKLLSLAGWGSYR